MEDLKDRFIGSLLGGAIGDALGGFCEGWSRERIAEVADLTAGYRDRVNRHGEVAWRAGVYTDDTQQALVLAESIFDRGGVDPEDIARRLLTMWRAGELYGYGQAFRETLERLDAGVPWQDAASTDRPSNGAVMKIAPVGLWYGRRPEEIEDAALAASHVTHKDPRAVAPAVACACVVGHLATCTSIVVDDIVSLAASAARKIDALTAGLIERVPELLALDEEKAYRAMLEMPLRPHRRGSGIPGEGPVTFLVALGSFLRRPDDFEGVVRRALCTGGDVDTFETIAGNLAGAHIGVGKLPDRLMSGLDERSRIEELALALCRESETEQMENEAGRKR